MKDRPYVSRDQLIRLLDQTEEDEFEQKSYPHPSFGSMPLSQWMPFIGLPEKRYLQQIEGIKERLNK